MTGLTRLRAGAAVALVSLCIPLLLPGLAAAAAATYTKESEQAFAGQLDKGEVETAAINHKIGTVRIGLKDGRKFVFHYTAGGQQAAEARLRSHGISVTVLKSKKKKSHTLGSHPRRTIAIIVVVVVVIGAAVFLLVRRRGSRRD